jgi:hypothetical protein
LPHWPMLWPRKRVPPMPHSPADLRKQILACDPACPVLLSREQVAAVLMVSEAELSQLFGNGHTYRTASVLSFLHRRFQDAIAPPPKQVSVVVYPGFTR